MKQSQFVLIFGSLVFIGVTLTSIDAELSKVRKTLLLIKDGIDFDAVHTKAEEVSIQQETKDS